jgi:hypothetical protein
LKRHLGGIGEDSAFWNDITTTPPPMSRQAFVAAAGRWLNDGEGACTNKWNGTITETSSASERVTFAPAAGGRAVTSESKVTITVVENEATAAVQVVNTDFTDVPLKECLTHVRHTYSVNGTRVPVNLSIVLKVAPIPSGIGLQLPPGFELPPGMTLPPGAPYLALPPRHS